MDSGLLVLRLVVGLLIAGHGVQKVSFRLGGNGLAGGTEEFRRTASAGKTHRGRRGAAARSVPACSWRPASSPPWRR